MTRDVDWYLREISRRSNRFGDKLVELMDLNEVSALRFITLEQAKEFYEKLVEKDNE